MKNPSPSLLVKAWIEGPVPPWTKRAIARILRAFIPNISTMEWEKRLVRSNWEETIISLFEDGHLLGRWFAFYQAVKLEGLSDSFAVEVRRAFESNEKMCLEMAEKLKRENPKAREVFEKSCRSRISFRSRDQKAVRVYFLLILFWPHVETFQGKPLRELYQWMLPYLKSGERESELDPIDAEDRRYKWFEKLCQRNLGLHTRPRGRKMASIKKIKKKPTI